MMQENSRNFFLRKAVILIPAVFVLLLSACGGGDSDSQVQAIDPDRLTVNEEEIKTNVDEGDTSHAQVSGSVFIQTSDADCEAWITIDLGWLGSDSVCVSRAQPIVHVHWRNKTTGESGNVEAEYKGYSNPSRRYSWKASVRIASGTNEIEFSSWGEPVTVFVNAGVDLLPPSVVSTYPLDESDQVAWNSSISVRFSESVDPSTVNSDSLIVSMTGGGSIYGDISLSESGLYASFKPSTLYMNTQYFVTLTTDITDISGKSLDSSYSWSFSTGEGDYDPPIVTATTPQADEIDYSLFRSISASFNQPIDHSSVTSDSISVRDIDHNPVDGWITLTTSGGTDTITFEPTNPLQPSTVYTVTLVSSIADNAGNTLAGDYNWSFTTAAPDVTPPSVLGVTPSDGDGCIARNTAVSVTFDEDMDSTTLDISTFLLTDTLDQPVSGSITTTYNRSVFTPETNLAYGTIYRATVTTGAEDMSGNALSMDHLWLFTTETGSKGSWTPMSTTNVPSGRQWHSAVWTGDEMIIWGGGWSGTGALFNTGGRYHPLSDTWQATDTVGAPSARSSHTAVWTGNEMIIWGGSGGGQYHDSGARYDPLTDSWQAISTVGAPSPRNHHIAVWTGSEMIIWGGSGPRADGGTFSVNDGARYNPTTDTWQPVTTTGSPNYNYGTDWGKVAWTGSEMIVLSKFNFNSSSGGRYNPANDTWQSISSQGAPHRIEEIVWTGKELLVWGSNYFGTYDPSTDNWQDLSRACALAFREFTASVWTGDEIIIWGGYPRLDSGGSYSTSTGLWSSTSLINAPTPRSGNTAVWTGSEMLVWGGVGGNTTVDAGGRYVP